MSAQDRFKQVHAEFFYLAKEISQIIDENNVMRRKEGENSAKLRELQSRQAVIQGELTKLMANEEPTQ